MNSKEQAFPFSISCEYMPLPLPPLPPPNDLFY